MSGTIGICPSSFFKKGHLNLIQYNSQVCAGDLWETFGLETNWNLHWNGLFLSLLNIWFALQPFSLACLHYSFLAAQIGYSPRLKEKKEKEKSGLNHTEITSPFVLEKRTHLLWFRGETASCQYKVLLSRLQCHSWSKNILLIWKLRRDDNLCVGLSLSFSPAP